MVEAEEIREVAVLTVDVGVVRVVEGSLVVGREEGDALRELFFQRGATATVNVFCEHVVDDLIDFVAAKVVIYSQCSPMRHKKARSFRERAFGVLCCCSGSNPRSNSFFRLPLAAASEQELQATQAFVVDGVGWQGVGFGCCLFDGGRFRLFAVAVVAARQRQGGHGRRR